MTYEFENPTPMTIDDDLPSKLHSTIEVAELSGRISRIAALVDLQHTCVGDLHISLQSPAGQRVVLFDDLGGSGEDMRETRFDDGAARAVAEGKAPFVGSFRPLERLAGLAGSDPNGTWTLQIADRATHDGGVLRGWSLTIETDELAEPI